MKLGIIRGADLKEVKSKKFNIYLGISLGNKWFTEEHIKGYLVWAIENTKHKVAILIADTIHALNYEFRNKLKREKAIKKSLKKGDEFELLIKKIILQLPKSEQDKIEIIRWNKLEDNLERKDLVSQLYKEFERNCKFKSKIIEIVKSHLSKEKRKFDEKAIGKMCNYILDELPELFSGFSYKGVYYNAYIYPQDSALTDFVEEIQTKKLFPEFSEKFEIKKNIFIELK
jgi:tRNA-dependent cyclodipeptide synthase